MGLRVLDTHPLNLGVKLHPLNFGVWAYRGLSDAALVRTLSSLILNPGEKCMGKRKEQKLKLVGLDMFRWDWGQTRERWGQKVRYVHLLWSSKMITC